jgi:hypothetical protein
MPKGYNRAGDGARPTKVRPRPLTAPDTHLAWEERRRGPSPVWHPLVRGRRQAPFGREHRPPARRSRAALAAHQPTARGSPHSTAQRPGLTARPRPCGACGLPCPATPTARTASSMALAGVLLAAAPAGIPPRSAVPSPALTPWPRRLDPALVRTGAATARRDLQQAPAHCRRACRALPIRMLRGLSGTPVRELGDDYFHAAENQPRNYRETQPGTPRARKPADPQTGQPDPSHP